LIARRVHDNARQALAAPSFAWQARMSLMLLPGTTTGKQADARLGDC